MRPPRRAPPHPRSAHRRVPTHRARTPAPRRPTRPHPGWDRPASARRGSGGTRRCRSARAQGPRRAAWGSSRSGPSTPSCAGSVTSRRPDRAPWQPSRRRDIASPSPRRRETPPRAERVVTPRRTCCVSPIERPGWPRYGVDPPRPSSVLLPAVRKVARFRRRSLPATAPVRIRKGTPIARRGRARWPDSERRGRARAYPSLSPRAPSPPRCPCP